MAGEKAFLVEFDFVQNGMKLQTLNVQFIKNGGLYTIGCTDSPSEFSKSLPEFRVILTSFTVLDF